MTRFGTMLRVTGSLAALGAAGVTHALRAQQTDTRRPPAIVRVQVTDSLGTAVEGAEVVLMEGLKKVVASSRTDANGRHEFLVNFDSADYSVVARKIGFSRGDRFVSAEHAVVEARVTMKRLQGDLPTVSVTAEESAKRKSYHIDADQIAAASEPLASAYDIVYKLRPDMITSRAGTWSGRAAACPPLTNVWVNGKRYPPGFTFVDPAVAMRARSAGKGINRVNKGQLTILSEIEPEHIEEINYADCFDHTVAKVGATDAIFITLKPGVEYHPGAHSFVAADSTRVVIR